MADGCPYHLVLFDVDRTLYRRPVQDDGNPWGSFWSLLAHRIDERTERNAFDFASVLEERVPAYETRDEYGVVEAQEEIVDLWLDEDRDWVGSYEELVDLTAAMHAAAGMTEDTYREAVDELVFRDGVGEVLDALHEDGVVTGTVSGGLWAQGERAREEHDIDYVFASCAYTFDEDGSVADWHVLPSDHEGKVVRADVLRQKYGLDWDEIAFVGDGDNDVPLAEPVGCSIAYNGTDALIEAADYSIEQDEEDFTAVLAPVYDEDNTRF